MIEKLNQYQKEQLQIYKNKYIKIGLNTDRIDPIYAQKIMNEFYIEILKRKPVKVKIFKNPLICVMFINYYKYIKNKTFNKNEVREEVEKEVKEEVRNLSFINTYLYGSFDSSYFSFYSYMKNILKIKFKHLEKYNLYEKLCNFGYIYCLNDICIISEKPIKINKNIRGQLHNDFGPALEYDGNFSLWRLNGVRVPKEIVLTSANKLDPNLILKEKNVEIRRELFRKIGPDNVIKKLKAECIDKSKDNVYELYRVPLGNNNIVNYLKMKNPSVENIYHFECVEGNTIQEALAWRCPFALGDINNYKEPKILT